MARSDEDVSSAMVVPFFTLSREPSISSDVSRAAFALRPARFLTSSATTAKPLPCFPARAASTAAFKASRLVWKAMSSITLIILAISSLDELISCMAPVMLSIWETPVSADSRAAFESWSAWLALSALIFTWDASSVMLLVISCRDAACSVAPWERLVAIRKLFGAPPPTLSAAWLTPDKIVFNLSVISPSAWPRPSLALAGSTIMVKSPSEICWATCAFFWSPSHILSKALDKKPTSSCAELLILLLRSPSATASATLTAATNGLVILRLIIMAIPADTNPKTKSRIKPMACTALVAASSVLCILSTADSLYCIILFRTAKASEVFWVVTRPHCTPATFKGE